MTDLFVLLAVFGVAWVIADSKISLPFRHRVADQLGFESLFLTLLECPPCLSFWIGLGGGLIAGLGLRAVSLAFACVGFSVLAWAFVKKEI